MKALFYIEGNHVQHIGCRLTVTTKLIHDGFKKGGAFNLPDGRVEVVLEGSKDDITHAHREIKENLISWLEESARDVEAIKNMIGNPHPNIKVTDLDFDDNLVVLDIGLFSHSLTFDQIYKGVDVYKELTTAIRNLNNTLTNKSPSQ
ncbi:MAG: hypothetical protein PHD13_05210 [Methanocellales archaeon]|nr:hypothetical protein [Methanocellales archaeon]MDD3292068.1 hypothetical protein [Methanocellales archaeon]MDD5235551.1 hypothetical protein [Methanocellales archaeon]MDD5485575.1 hypothetical protein [Methanocellales archaeon]